MDNSLLRLILAMCCLWTIVANADELSSAVFSGDLAKLNALISQGADINSRDQYGNTVLMTAALLAKKAAVEALIDHGADIKATNQWGRNALDSVVSMGGDEATRLEIARILIDHGIDAGSRDSSGETPLHHAVTPDLAALLIAHGANVNATNNSGDTPLHVAAYRGYKDMVAFFIAHGADANIANKDGKTPKQMTTDGAIVALFQSGHNRLLSMIAGLHQNPGDEATRKSIMALAATLRPSPAIPQDAIDAAGKGRYLFANAKSEADVLASAAEYLKAIDLAPWVADDYYNLGVILEKTEFAKQALSAWRYYLASPGIPQADQQTVRQHAADLKYKIDEINKQESGHNNPLLANLYGQLQFGGIRKTLSNSRKIAIKPVINWQAAPPHYEALISCLVYNPTKGSTLWTGTYTLVDTDRYISLCDTRMHLVIKSDGSGFIGLDSFDPPDTALVPSDRHLESQTLPTVFRATLDELFAQHAKAMGSTPMYERKVDDGVHFYVGMPQGDDESTYAGLAVYETDCSGVLLHQEPRALPDDFVPQSAIDAHAGKFGDYLSSRPSCDAWFADRTGQSWLNNED